MNFLKLTNLKLTKEDGDDIWVNMDTVTTLRRRENLTRMEFVFGASYIEVKETPDEIIELIINEF